MNKTILAAALSVPCFAFAAAPNLVSNGSFENGLAGWTSTETPGTTIPVSVITYGTTSSTYGESIPMADAATLSPDAAGSKAVYFVDDQTTQTLSQTFIVTTAGSYNVGFSAYVPANGAQNPGQATFSGMVDNFTVLSTAVGNLPVTTWTSQTGSLGLSAGTHTVSFNFATSGGFSKDVLVDQVYVVATPVPEPGTYALMAAGLGALVFISRRRKL